MRIPSIAQLPGCITYTKVRTVLPINGTTVNYKIGMNNPKITSEVVTTEATHSMGAGTTKEEGGKEEVEVEEAVTVVKAIGGTMAKEMNIG